jgi:hypothetical protein
LQIAKPRQQIYLSPLFPELYEGLNYTISTIVTLQLQASSTLHEKILILPNFSAAADQPVGWKTQKRFKAVRISEIVKDSHTDNWLHLAAHYCTTRFASSKCLHMSIHVCARV